MFHLDGIAGTVAAGLVGSVDHIHHLADGYTSSILDETPDGGGGGSGAGNRKNVVKLVKQKKHYQSTEDLAATSPPAVTINVSGSYSPFTCSSLPSPSPSSTPHLPSVCRRPPPDDAT